MSKPYRPMHPRKRAMRIIRELEQLIIDKESWNDNRPEEMPFDVGAERVSLAQAREFVAAWDRGDKPEIARLAKKMSDDAHGELTNG